MPYKNYGRIHAKVEEGQGPAPAAQGSLREAPMAIDILGKLFFGSSLSLEWLDRGLEAAGLSPGGFPEPLRLAIVRLTKSALGLPQRGEPKGAAAEPLIAALYDSAALFALCYQGIEGFTDHNGEAMAKSFDERLSMASDTPESLEARVVSLALLSGYAHPDIAARYELEEDF
ncbi:MAG: hypothetical protein GDA47_01005 [Rhodospirillales bacterium]|nr:hypothetical protein [Rhodospirillales bacterium]